MIAAPRLRGFPHGNLRGLWTLYFRELLRSLKLWNVTLVTPAIRAVMFAIVLTVIFDRFGETMGGMDVIAFVIPGLIAAAILERAFEATAFSLVYDKMEGVIEDVVRAPLAPSEMVLAYMLSAATGALLVGIVVALALIPFGAGVPVGPAALAFFSLAGGLMIALFAQITGLWARKWDHISAVQTFILTPFVFMAGVFFSLDRLPEAGQLFVLANPMFYVVDGVRFGMTGHAESPPLLAALIVVAVIVIEMAVCLRLFAIGYRLKD